jgi:acetyl-CoA carboxylase carboxyl transferase subunit alpha
MAALEIEKKIEELEKKINELKNFAKNQGIDLGTEIKNLERKLDEMQSSAYKELSAWDKLSIAKLIERPTALDYIHIIFDNFIELHGDRSFGDDPSIVCGLAMLNNVAYTVIGQQKGRNTKENIKRNFAMTNPEGYRKALRLMKQAEKFNRPVICFVDTPGAFCGIGAEERGQGEAIATNLLEMSSLKAPIISIFIGEGGSGGALALAVADEVWMLEHSIYSILSPEGFASILWKDSSRSKEAAEIMKITAQDLKEFGIIDRILEEPIGGAHKDTLKMGNTIKRNLLSCIEGLIKKPIDQLVEERYRKFRKMGKFTE